MYALKSREKMEKSVRLSSKENSKRLKRKQEKGVLGRKERRKRQSNRKSLLKLMKKQKRETNHQATLKINNQKKLFSLKMRAIQQRNLMTKVKKLFKY